MKFQVGDRVKHKNPYDNHFNEIGRIIKIADNISSQITVEYKHNCTHNFLPYELRLANPIEYCKRLKNVI